MLMPGEVETPLLRQVDKTLKERLKSKEGQSALFAWLVEGAVAWYASDGSLQRSAPAKVRAFAGGLLDHDRVHAFLSEHCEFGEGLRVSSAKLHNEFKMEVSAETGEKWFHAQMKAKGFVKKTVRLGGVLLKGYEGLRLKDRVLTM